jgi:hypothetical protein
MDPTAQYGGLSTAQRPMGPSAASVEMTLLMMDDIYFGRDDVVFGASVGRRSRCARYPTLQPAGTQAPAGTPAYRKGAARMGHA